MQLKVIKSDGTLEEYLHTKVLGTFNNALALIDQPNIFAAEQFAEAITYYLYNKNSSQPVTTDEIHLKVQSILTATGYENAARALNDYHMNRKLLRKRIEVVDEHNVQDDFYEHQQWRKSIIVQDLMSNDGLDYHTARAIASSVEEKVLNLGMTRIRKGLIKQIVAADRDTMLEAQKQLQLTV